MCGRFSLFLPADEIEDRFGAAFREAFRPRFNAVPGQALPVVRDDDRDHIRTARWGLIPSWSDDDASGIINARSETVADRRAFRDAYRARRCLVPADGFYEWRTEGDGKRPYRVTIDGGAPFAMAGLWETWAPSTTQTGLDDFGGGARSADPEPVVAFTVLTRASNAFMRDYHDRQPVVLGVDEETDWLDGCDVAAVDGPGPAAFDAYRVSTAVNSPANESPAVVQPVE